jgi:dienelactone hydrolase
MKRGGILVALLGAMLGVPATASAAITSVFSGQTVSATGISCPAQSDGVRVCHGTDAGPDLRLKSFDTTPLEVYVVLPPAPGSGSDGHYPLIVQSHGWGGAAGGPDDGQFFGPTAGQWAKQGYAVLQLTARGFGDSCGKKTSTAGQLACGTTGYIRLDDERYEVRDVQNAVGLLVDAGVADATKIGVTGESYGGGVSLELATLKDRVMKSDGSLQPWVSHSGTPLSVTAAAPMIPWSDLVYSLTPNGHTLDYQVTSPTDDLNPIGLVKDSFVSGLFALGQTSGTYSPPGTDPQSDLTSWFAAIQQGDPPNPQDAFITDTIARYHSAYYVLDGAYGAAKEPPPPLLIANGFTDDLFPVDEALRYRNLEHALYPSDPISLFDGDFGHMRAQNKSGDMHLLSDRIQAFFDHYLKGQGAQPASDFTAMSETCGSGQASGGPYTASSWAGLHPGIVVGSSGSPLRTPSQTIRTAGGDPSVAKAFDPVAGGGACATAPATDETGVATYRLPAATGNGYTLLGSPSVVANLSVTGSYPQIAARLLDVDPSAGTETLVARGLYRPDPGHPGGVQVFQLHPGAWHFAAGHIPKLELLGQDTPYARPNNEPFSIDISGLEFDLPVHETPGAPRTPPIVIPPQQTFHPGAACPNLPHSRIYAKRVGGSRHGLTVTGGAGEQPCAFATAAMLKRQRVTKVLVSIYHPAPHGRCRFLLSSGRLSQPRACSRPVSYRAHGTGSWSLRLHVHISPGTYLVRSDAVDGYNRHQRHSGSSVVRIKVH